MFFLYNINIDFGYPIYSYIMIFIYLFIYFFDLKIFSITRNESHEPIVMGIIVNDVGKYCYQLPNVNYYRKIKHNFFYTAQIKNTFQFKIIL